MKEKKKIKKLKMPLWVDIVFTTVSLLYLKLKYKIKIDRSVLKKQKEGCLLFYNHYSNKDHYVLKASTGYRRATYVLASSFFLNKVLNKILTWAKAISKDQFKPDLKAIRNMKNALDNNQIVIIAPAGQTTIDGNSPFISRSVVKFIRMCKVDVLAHQERGVYLTFPKWRKAKTNRKCAMETRFVRVIDKEEIPNLTDDEIYQRVKDSLDIKEYEDQLTMKRKIKGKNIISGLEQVIVKCPRCNELHSFELVNDKIICNHCHLEIGMDEYGLLTYNDDLKYYLLPELYDYQRTEFGKMYESGVCFKTKCELFTDLKTPNTFENLGEGEVTLCKDELKFEINIDNELKTFSFNPHIITQLPFDPGRRFEIPNEECIFRLYPKNTKEVMDYVLIIDYLNNEREKNESNT